MSDAHSAHSTSLDDAEQTPAVASEASEPSTEEHAEAPPPTTRFARKRILPPSQNEQDYATPSRWFG